MLWYTVVVSDAVYASVVVLGSEVVVCLVCSSVLVCQGVVTVVVSVGGEVVKSGFKILTL